MSFLCTAYGLRIDSAFSLPGIQSGSGRRDPSLPRLSLALRDFDELDAERRSRAMTPVWRGILGDGLELRLDRGAGGDQLFSYGDRAFFALDATKTRLDCASDRSEPDCLRVLLTKVIPSVSVMCGYEALHAAVVDSQEGAVAIMGASGAGKSSLAVELLRRGWALLADDQLTLDRDEDGNVRAHPGTRHMNIAMNAREEADDDDFLRTIATFAGERWALAGSFTERSRPVRMLCLLERRPGLQAVIERLEPSPVLLAPHMLGLTSSAERQRDRFALYADLLESATLVRVTGGDGDSPARLANLIAAASQDASHALAGDLA